jgi:hypothetical protein
MLYRVMLPNQFQKRLNVYRNNYTPIARWSIDSQAPFVYSFFVHVRSHHDRASTGTSDEGRGMGFNSEPVPLSARLRPVREKW